MNKELKQKWIDALRSGDYEQGKGLLCRITPDGAKYCCLGVLCEVENGEDIWELETGHGTTFCSAQGNGGVYGEQYLDYSTITGLMHKNDGVFVDKLNFTEIADWIDENVPGE